MESIQEQKRKETDAYVVDIYRAVERDMPSAAWTRKLLYVGSKVGMTIEGVKKLLKRNGIDNPRRQTDGTCAIKG